MKYKLSALLSLAIIIFVVACGSHQQTTPSSQNSGATSTEESLGLMPSASAQIPISNPTPTAAEPGYASKNVEYVGHVAGPSLAVVIQDNYAYLGVGYKLVVLDISNPAAPVLVGKSELLPGIVVNMVVSGDYAYVADDEAGMRIINIADPSQPMFTGFYSIPRFAVEEDSFDQLKYDNVASVAVVGRYAYVAEYQYGLRVVNISDPTNPVEVGFYDTPGDAHDVVAVGDMAYVADFDLGLRVVKVTDPANPVELGFYDTPGYAQGVAVAGDYAFVSDGAEGLQVVNIANPAQPVLTSTISTQGYVQSVEIVDGYAYVAVGSAGLLVLNLADPARPAYAGSYDTPGYAWDVAVAEDYIFVADANSGLIILRFTGD